MGNDQTYLTMREAAGRLNVSYGTVRGAVVAGDLQAYRFGAGVGTWRIAASDLTEYVARHRCQKDSQSPAHARRDGASFNEPDVK